jgi:hypothetical protein
MDNDPCRSIGGNHMKHLFAIVREERTNFMGEVKSEKVQRGCVYNPVKGEALQDVQVQCFDFKGDTWIDNLLGIIGYLKPADEPVKVVCNKKFSIVGRMMERAIKAVILQKADAEDESDMELAQNAVNNGLSIEMIQAAYAAEDKIAEFAKILVVSVIGLDFVDGFTTEHLMTIANYVLAGCRFDNIYYKVDDSEGLQNLKDQSTKQFWLNINAIKRAMTEGIELNSRDEYKDVAPINIVYVD